jgi:signal transduction histidine kinase
MPQQDSPADSADAAHRPGRLARVMDPVWPALRQLLGALGTALVALALLAALVVAAVLCVVGVGLLVLPVLLRGLHALADRERERLSRWGAPVPDPGLAPTRLREAAGDDVTRRELGWLAGHATGGLLVSLVGVLLPLSALRDLSFPLWWTLVPDGEAASTLSFWTVHTWAGAGAVVLLGLVWLGLTVLCSAPLAGLLDRRGRRLLAPGPETDLPLRIAELTATRAAALDAHATELRRIERSLHDSTQNPIVAVTVLIGAARRSLTRDPAAADAVLEQAQAAAEQALLGLRAVARGILPPVLEDRGLDGALAGLAASSPVPCEVDVDVPRRCAASVEAAAYFTVSEALTNISRHSGAQHATVRVRIVGDRLHLRVDDDGHGGADEARGSGLSGIRRRIEAHDGTLVLTSPPGGPTTLEVELPCGS